MIVHGVAVAVRGRDMGDGRCAADSGDISSIDRIDPLCPTDRVPIVTTGNVEKIAAVLADPRRAWRLEPAARKVAAANLRGLAIPEDADDTLIDSQFERLVGDNDMVPGIWLKRAVHVAKAVALIRTPAGEATGFLVSDDLLLTNWHVFRTLESAQDPRVSVLFGYEENEGGRIPSSVSVGVNPDRFFVTGDQVLDFALVAVKALPNGKPPGTRFGKIGMNPALGKAVLGQPLNIIQHPGGKARKLAFRQNLLLDVDDSTRLIYSTDTMPGSSGSPVFNDEWVLVAVHHSAEQAEDSQGRPIDVNGNPVTSETPDHLRDWIANAGIRVSRIVDHLRTLALVGEQAQLLAAVLRP